MGGHCRASGDNSEGQTGVGLGGRAGEKLMTSEHSTLSRVILLKRGQLVQQLMEGGRAETNSNTRMATAMF